MCSSFLGVTCSLIVHLLLVQKLMVSARSVDFRVEPMMDCRTVHAGCGSWLHTLEFTSLFVSVPRCWWYRLLSNDSVARIQACGHDDGCAPRRPSFCDILSGCARSRRKKNGRTPSQ